MPRLKRIYPYPAQGRADRPTDEDPVADVAIRGCRSVAELYSDALARLDLPCRSTTLSLTISRNRNVSEVQGFADVDPPREGGESAHGWVPSSFADHTPQARARMLLELIHGIVSRLAVDRGWDVEALTSCRQHVLDQDLEYRWTSPPKTSPDRRHLAYADFRLPPDGYGRVRLRVVRRDDETVVATSEEALAFCTREGFARAAASMRWAGADRVSLVPYDYVPATRGGTLALSRDGETWHSVVDDYCTVRPVPAGDPALDPLPVHVEGRGDHAPEQPHEFFFVGGGPLEPAVDPFHEAFRAELRRLSAPSGQAWWSGAEARTCSVVIFYGGAKPVVRSRRTGNRLSISVDQPASSLVGQDPGALAHDVARQVVALVRRRTGLGPHPELPDA